MSLFEDLDLAQKTLLVIALISSLILVIQVFLSFFGGDMDFPEEIDTDIGGTDGDASGGDSAESVLVSVFTLRNLIAFLCSFSWTALYMLDTGKSPTTSYGIAVVVGVVFVTLLTTIFLLLNKMQENSLFQLEEAIDKTGVSYLPIPAAGSGIGKVSISVGGSLKELDACSNNGPIKTGTRIVVTDVKDGILIVEALQENN